MLNNLQKEKIRIQIVRADQIDQLTEISRSTFTETFSEVNSPDNMQMYLDDCMSREKLTEEMNLPNTEFYFAVTDHNIVGYLKINTGNAQIEFKDKNTLEIERVYVLKDYLGNGIGQALFDFAVHKAHDRHAEFLWLGVWENNLRAIRFYQKNGMTVFGKHTFRLGKDIQTDLMMRLELNDPR
jgi:diamine N-acetyltransferase